MAVVKVEKRVGTLVLVVLTGGVIGSYLGELFRLLPGSTNVVRDFLATYVTIGFGDFTNNKPLLIDLSAIRLQLGFQLKISWLSVVGFFTSLYFFRWYR